MPPNKPLLTRTLIIRFCFASTRLLFSEFCREQTRVWLTGKYLTKAHCEILQSFGRMAPALLGHDPAGVPDFIDCLHHGGPIVVSFEQRHLEAFPQTFLFASFAAVFLDMKLLNALTQDAYPLLRPAIGDHVADIKMPTYRRAVKLIDVTSRFERAEQEVVPDVLDCDLYPELFRQRNGFANLGLRARISIRVTHLFIYHRWNQ